MERTDGVDHGHVVAHVPDGISYKHLCNPSQNLDRRVRRPEGGFVRVLWRDRNGMAALPVISATPDMVGRFRGRLPQGVVGSISMVACSDVLPSRRQRRLDIGQRQGNMSLGGVEKGQRSAAVFGCVVTCCKVILRASLHDFEFCDTGSGNMCLFVTRSLHQHMQDRYPSIGVSRANGRICWIQ
jgi:hypothetical protein